MPCIRALLDKVAMPQCYFSCFDDFSVVSLARVHSGLPCGSAPRVCVPVQGTHTHSTPTRPHAPELAPPRTRSNDTAKIIDAPDQLGIRQTLSLGLSIDAQHQLCIGSRRSPTCCAKPIPQGWARKTPKLALVLADTDCERGVSRGPIATMHIDYRTTSACDEKLLDQECKIRGQC